MTSDDTLIKEKLFRKYHDKNKMLIIVVLYMRAETIKIMKKNILNEGIDIDQLFLEVETTNEGIQEILFDHVVKTLQKKLKKPHKPSINQERDILVFTLRKIDNLYCNPLLQGVKTPCPFSTYYKYLSST